MGQAIHPLHHASRRAYHFASTMDGGKRAITIDEVAAWNGASSRALKLEFPSFRGMATMASTRADVESRAQSE